LCITKKKHEEVYSLIRKEGGGHTPASEDKRKGYILAIGNKKLKPKT